MLLNCQEPRGSRTQILSACCLRGDALLSFLLIVTLHHSSEALQSPRRTEQLRNTSQSRRHFNFLIFAHASSLDSHLPGLKLQQSTDWAPDQSSHKNSRRQTCLAVTEYFFLGKSLRIDSAA